MMRTSLFDCISSTTYPGAWMIWDSLSWFPGIRGGPWFPVTQRSYRLRLSTASPLSLVGAAARRFCASGVRAGILPSGVSTISPVRRFGLIGLCQASIPYSFQS
jgi:hypothetical protein